MPVKITCITGGCLALLNGGERCEGDRCEACLFGKPNNANPNGEHPNGEHPLAGLLRSLSSLDDLRVAFRQATTDQLADYLGDLGYGKVVAELNLLPDDTLSAVLQLVVDKVTGRSRTVAETAAKLGLDVAQVELARFEWRRIEATHERE